MLSPSFCAFYITEPPDSFIYKFEILCHAAIFVTQHLLDAVIYLDIFVDIVSRYLGEQREVLSRVVDFRGFRPRDAGGRSLTWRFQLFFIVVGSFKRWTYW